MSKNYFNLTKFKEISKVLQKSELILIYTISFSSSSSNSNILVLDALSIIHLSSGCLNIYINPQDFKLIGVLKLLVSIILHSKFNL